MTVDIHLAAGDVRRLRVERRTDATYLLVFDDCGDVPLVQIVLTPGDERLLVAALA